MLNVIGHPEKRLNLDLLNILVDFILYDLIQFRLSDLYILSKISPKTIYELKRLLSICKLIIRYNKLLALCKNTYG